MKNIRNLIIAVLAAVTINAQASPANWPPTYLENRVETKAMAEDCCKADAKVALICKDCKTINEKSGTEKEGILGWFKADSMHDCDGCKGKITVKQIGAGKVQDVRYTHECSKCGKNSASVCSTHAKAAK